MGRSVGEMWSDIERLFHEAHKLPAEQMSSFLSANCRGDADLQREVEALLHSAGAGTGLLHPPAIMSPPVPAMGTELAPGTLLGAYRVERLLGRGGMGEVYLASRADGLFQKRVAAKVLRPEAAAHAQRFQAERQILAQLEHPGIARLLDGGVIEDGRPYLLMEYVAGTSITDFCNQKALPLNERLDLFQQVAEAVAFAHSHQVIHRDLKSSNILVTAAGKAKLLDFGVAKLTNTTHTVTTTGAPMTLSHAAPEQLRGEPITQAADLYALGVVLYEILTGDLPWSGIAQQPAAVMLHRLLHEEPRLASEIPGPFPAKYLQDSLDRILAKCVQKSAGDRYPGVTSLLDDLNRHRRGEPILAGRAFSPQAPPRIKTDAERRQLTVVFCDLAGSTELADQLDPEAFRDILVAYQNKATEVVDRYGGYVAQVLGDGLLIYFGYPNATGYDAESAVRAGYDLIAAVTSLNDSLKKDLPEPLAVRVGVHTGPVVVGQMDARSGGGQRETLALGVTTNVAARLQSAAEPNTVALSGVTMKLVPGLFITRPLGPINLKGIEQPMPVFQLVQPSGVRTRMEAADSLTPFVGREQELLLLQDRWEQVQERQGQAVLVIAEPGLGKSRILVQIRERMKDSAHSWLECRCSPLLRNSAYQPIMDLLQRALQFLETDSQAVKLQRLEQALDAIGHDKAEAVPLIAPLLNISLGQKYKPSPYGPELKRKKTMDLLTGWLMVLARQQPLLLVIEDLHWADPSSLDLIGQLVEQLPGNPVLLLLTARPEYRPDWPHRNHVTPMILQPLRQKDSGQMLNSITGKRSLHPVVRDKIIQRAGGVPLFVEELTQALLESGQLIERTGQLELGRPIEELAIPATLQDSLMARLDRLGAAKEVAQCCAVVGREIPYALLVHVAEMDEVSLQLHLKRLTETGLLSASGALPQAVYTFKHALIQDTAYDSLLKSKRQALHGRIASAMERHFKTKAKSEPEVLAAHFERGEMRDKAVTYYAQAAEAYESRQTFVEATALAEKGLALLPETEAARHPAEIGLWLVSAMSSVWKRGFSHPDTLAALVRVQGLLNTAPPPVQIKALFFLHLWYLTSGGFDRALEFSAAITELGRSLGAPIFECSGLACASMSLWALGRQVESETRYEAALKLADAPSSKAFAELSGVDPILVAFFTKMLSQWQRGYPDRAEQTSIEMLEWSQGIGHPIMLAHATTARTVLYVYRRQPAKMLESYEPAAAMCRRYGLMDYSLWADVALGLSRCMLGNYDEGLPVVRNVVATLRANGCDLLAPYVDARLAEQCIAAGQLEEARGLLEDGLERIRRSGSHYWEAEVHRIRGELLVALGDQENDAEAVEVCFRRALELSRAQGAKSLELRAATSLARHLSGRARAQEARAVLLPVYEWFKEGFELADLTDARLLLDSF